MIMILLISYVSGVLLTYLLISYLYGVPREDDDKLAVMGVCMVGWYFVAPCVLLVYLSNFIQGFLGNKS
jgi:hypothetical protein